MKERKTFASAPRRIRCAARATAGRAREAAPRVEAAGG